MKQFKRLISEVKTLWGATTDKTIISVPIDNETRPDFFFIQKNIDKDGQFYYLLVITNHQDGAFSSKTYLRMNEENLDDLTNKISAIKNVKTA